AVEHVEKQGFDNVIPVVAQRYLGSTYLVGKTVEGTATQTGAETTGGFTLGNHFLNNAVGVFFDDMERYAYGSQVFGQHMLWKPWLLLIHIHRHQLKTHRRCLLQTQQNIQHRVGILAAGEAHHHLVAVLNHVVIGYGTAHETAQPLLQFVEFKALFTNWNGFHRTDNYRKKEGGHCTDFAHQREFCAAK